MEEALVVDSNGEVLGVPRSPPVGVEDIRGNVDCVSDVAAALVEGHDGLDLEPHLDDELEQAHVRAPLVLLGAILLDDAPPHVHHDAVHTGLLELLEIGPEIIRVLQHVVVVDDSQLHREIPLHATLSSGSLLHEIDS
ncbi:unnamed protein product [Spirodela intermedia]|uniref:Uncharacterized protein n=1 Tax=Spirodela intermedia TaxID=51605 RepID=A0A7I8K9Q9_SPIIN|nr:unnamed protein product [Spirodela intermedia]